MPDEAPVDANTANRAPADRRGSLLIAQKLFLSYVLPLAVLIVAGLALPFVLWSYLGNFVDDYNSRVQFADRAVEWRRSALDTDAQARNYVLSHDVSFESQFQENRINFGTQYRTLADYLEARNESGTLRTSLERANKSYRDWLKTVVNPLVRGTPGIKRGSGISNVAVSRVRSAFISVRTDMDSFVIAANEYRNQEQERARGFDIMRRITSVAIPVTSVLLAMLIGRSIALGITRPLEALTRATEALEAGDPNPLLAGQEAPAPGDEIGELQQAFQRMARTIRQREAVLRAQNEALESLNRRMEAILNSTNDGILMLDRAGGFSIVNERFANLFGLEAETIQDHTFEQVSGLFLSRFKNKTTARERIVEILNDPETVADETFEIVEPLTRTLRVYTAPVHGDPEEDGTPELLGRIFAFRDVTRETIVDRMKTEFVSTVSHELRTPLTAIKGYVDLMVGGQTGTLNPVQTEFLTMVQVSTKRLTALINDMLDISRIESGRMEIRQESVDYAPLVRQTVRMMQNEADTRHIHLQVEIVGEGTQAFPPVIADADRITQVLVNFISNGIKYTPSGGQVKVRVEFEDDFVTTCVEDNGIGISLEDQRKLFQKFFRADNSTTREVGGTGLGLAITKAILEKLNGSVWVESEPNQGTRFWFTLPTVEAARHRGEEAPPPSLSQHRIVLSIDGDVAALHRLGHELRNRGFVTANASTPAEALRRARDLRPDMITLDPLTGAFDGIALLHSLRGVEATRNTPILLTSIQFGGGVAHLRDTDHFLPRAASTEAFQSAVRAALPLPDGNDTHAGRVAVLVIGDASLANRVQAALHEQGPIHLFSVESADAAEKELGGNHPDVVILDLAVTTPDAAGALLSRQEKRRPGARLAVLVLVDDTLLDSNTYPLIPFGSGPLPLDRVAGALNLALQERTASSPPTAPANLK